MKKYKYFTIYTGRNSYNIKKTVLVLGKKRSNNNPIKYPDSCRVVSIEKLQSYSISIDEFDEFGYYYI